MGKWKKNATVFEVGVNYNDIRGAQASIPKPVYDLFGRPARIRFLLNGKKVEVQSADE